MTSIIKAIVTEKSLRLTDAGQYTFAVHRDASKPQIANEVARLFKVEVIAVNTVTIPGKLKRRGGVVGRRTDIVKAIVTIKKGQKISEFSVSE